MTGPVVFDAHSLPASDNVNAYAFSVALDGQWFLQRGKMIAYYGDIDFHGVGLGRLDRLIARSFHSPCTPRTGWWPRGAGRWSSPTGPSTSTRTTSTTGT